MLIIGAISLLVSLSLFIHAYMRKNSGIVTVGEEVSTPILSTNNDSSSSSAYGTKT
jgi:hypothetical protein